MFSMVVALYLTQYGNHAIIKMKVIFSLVNIFLFFLRIITLVWPLPEQHWCVYFTSWLYEQ